MSNRKELYDRLKESAGQLVRLTIAVYDFPDIDLFYEKLIAAQLEFEELKKEYQKVKESK